MRRTFELVECCKVVLFSRVSTFSRDVGCKVAGPDTVCSRDASNGNPTHDAVTDKSPSLLQHGYVHEYIHSGSIFGGSRARETYAIAQGPDTAHLYVFDIGCRKTPSAVRINTTCQTIHQHVSPTLTCYQGAYCRPQQHRRSPSFAQQSDL